MTFDPAGPTLVVMAAGDARRFGSLKQLAPAGPGGEAIMEYSLHDAFAAGFEKAILVVRRELEQAFREAFVDRAARRVEIAFAYQDLAHGVPNRRHMVGRHKPWGTAHAAMCAAELIDGPFAVINADDYYGDQALADMRRFLDSVEQRLPMPAAMAGYALRNTLSDHGSVSRGVCQQDADGMLLRVVEVHGLVQQGDGGAYRDAAGETRFVPGDAITSMNLWGFPAAMIEHLQQRFRVFLEGPHDASREYELPTVAQQLVDEGRMQVRILATPQQWCGVTYERDLPIVQERLASLVREGVYPERLW